MNPRDKDLLFQHIFDGQDQSEILRLLEQDQEAQDEASFLVQLRHDLKGLQHVPECQLSTERLRDAILASEMQTRQRRGFWLWGALPLGFAAAAACLLVWFNQKQPTSSNHVQVSSPTINVIPNSTSPDEEMDWLYAPQPELSTEPAIEPAISKTPAPTRGSGKTGRSTRTSLVASVSKPGSMVAMFSTLSAQTGSKAEASKSKKPVPTVVESGHSEEPSSPELVVVNNKESGSSGAPVAKEESSSKNIVCRG